MAVLRPSRSVPALYRSMGGWIEILEGDRLRITYPGGKRITVDMTLSDVLKMTLQQGCSFKENQTAKFQLQRPVPNTGPCPEDLVLWIYPKALDRGRQHAAVAVSFRIFCEQFTNV